MIIEINKNNKGNHNNAHERNLKRSEKENETVYPLNTASTGLDCENVAKNLIAKIT